MQSVVSELLRGPVQVSGTILQFGNLERDVVALYCYTSAAQIVLIAPGRPDSPRYLSFLEIDERISIPMVVLSRTEGMATSFEYDAASIGPSVDPAEAKIRYPGASLLGKSQVSQKSISSILGLYSEPESKENCLIVNGTEAIREFAAGLVDAEIPESWITMVLVSGDNLWEQLSELNLLNRLQEAGYGACDIKTLYGQSAVALARTKKTIEPEASNHDEEACEDLSRRHSIEMDSFRQLVADTRSRSRRLATENGLLRRDRALNSSATPDKTASVSPGPTLRELYEKKLGNMTDKWTHYLEYYDRLFSSKRGEIKSLLEIGVQDGGSLEIWADYFPEVEVVVGVDINPDCAKLNFGDPRIKVEIGPAEDDEVADRAVGHAGEFDLIIDDGSHMASHVVDNFVQYFGSVSNGGTYIVEDTHTSYWAKFGGGLEYEGSHLNFFKSLTDFVNYQHWGEVSSVSERFNEFYSGDKSVSEVFFNSLHRISSISFTNSVINISKSADKSDLGHRLVVGERGDVTDSIDYREKHHMATAKDMHFKQVR